MRSLKRVLAILPILLYSGITFAAATGKITGRITLSDTKEPALAGTVQILELKTGAKTDLDGYYTILNIQPGIYTIRFGYIGYKEVIVRGVVIASGITFTQNISLSPSGMGLDTIVVTAERPKIQLDQTSGSTEIRSEDLRTTTADNLTQVLATHAGVYIDKNGALHVRGGRQGEVSFLVDGIDIRDPIVATNTNIDLDADAVSEVNMLTDGFSAEYGQANSGVVNVSLREGNPDKYSAKALYTTDRLINKTSFGTDKTSISLSGPVPATKELLKNPLTFMIQVNSDQTNTYLSYGIQRQANNYLGIGVNLPERQWNDYNVTTKLAYQFPSDNATAGVKKLTLTYSGSYTKWDLYPYGEANVSGDYGYRYKYDTENRPWAETKRNSFILNFTNNLSSTANYNISFTYQNSHTLVQPGNQTPGQFTLRTQVEDASNNGQLAANGYQAGYVDANRNGVYDGGGEGYEDINHNGTWDRGEPFIDLHHTGNFEYPDPFTDVNHNGKWDVGEPFVDLNGTGHYSSGDVQLPEQDLNHNGRWDGERFQDAYNDGHFHGWNWVDKNGNGVMDPGEQLWGTPGVRQDGEGYNDLNLNGKLDPKQNFTQNEDTPEPYIDGDFWYDTGEPFIDQPDPITGEYSGVWKPGDFWVDLPSTNVGFGMQVGMVPTANGKYDGPDGFPDEYELFCRPATPSELRLDPSKPVMYNGNWNGNVSDWPRDSVGRLDPYKYVAGKSTWVKRTLDNANNQSQWRFHPPLGFWVSYDPFSDYNHNGIQNGRDLFLNPGQWDESAVWEDRQSEEYSMKMSWESQVNKYHDLKAGVELKQRDLQMQSIIGPDLPYTGQVALPAGSPYPDRGDQRDFYHYKPIEGSVYFVDKMEFEGLIVNASLRDDFMITDKNLRDQTEQAVANGVPGAILAAPGRSYISPRLGISHPITKTSKLFFNYGQFYQEPSFTYYFKSTTANVASGAVVGNPNLDYEKDVQYALGVQTELPDNTTFKIQGYFKDYFNQVGTQAVKYGPLTIDTYANKAYGRARGFETELDHTFSGIAGSGDLRSYGTYDFSFTAGKSSTAEADAQNRLLGVPANTEEHPLDWDERHRVNAQLALQFDEGKYPMFGDFKLPMDDWLLSIEFTYGSGVPYTPSQYTTGLDPNLIPINSARYPWTENTNLRFEKHFRIGQHGTAANKTNRTVFLVGVDVQNLWDKRNVQNLYTETGNPTQAIHPDDPAYNPFDFRSDYDADPRNFSPPRQILFRFGVSWE